MSSAIKAASQSAAVKGVATKAAAADGASRLSGHYPRYLEVWKTEAIEQWYKNAVRLVAMFYED